MGGAGGEGGGDFRAKVWSMSGGPYCRPKHWRRNTAFAMLGVFLVCIPIAMKSAELEIALVYMFDKIIIVCCNASKAAHARTSNSFSDLVQELWNQGRLRKRALNTLVLLPVETTLFAFVSCFADDNVSA
ncbi:unnamed protein product [Brassica rapa]|uniref:Uncharacterized protein n=1 Tax=Brassica campestris TaxID=3711 RepID=A0A3P5XTS9_BRACM|nr:unnamed protein product [Brassica rapa]VDC58109.1 unnamed protein product [Brassica rapa]